MWLKKHLNRDLKPIIAQLIELTFINDVEYFLNKENLDCAKVLFFDEVPATISNTWNIDTANKQAVADNTFYDSYAFDDATLQGWSTDNFYYWSGLLDTSACGSGGVFSLTRYTARTDLFPSYLERTVTDEIYAVSISGWHNDLDTSDLIIDLYVDGVQKQQVDLNCAAGGSYAAAVDFGTTIYERIPAGSTLRLDFSSTGVSTYIDQIRLYKIREMVLDLTPNPVKSVMPIYNATGGTVEVIATDGVSEYMLTNKELLDVSLSKLQIKVKGIPADLATTLYLDNLAILWEE